MPFYHPVLEEGLRSALRDLARFLPQKGESDLAQCGPIGHEALDWARRDRNHGKEASMADAGKLELLRQGGLTADDLAWLDALGWNDAAVPPANASNAADYRRREAALNHAIRNLAFTERGESREGRMAAAIGARLADLRDPEDDSDLWGEFGAEQAELAASRLCSPRLHGWNLRPFRAFIQRLQAKEGNMRLGYLANIAIHVNENLDETGLRGVECDLCGLDGVVAAKHVLGRNHLLMVTYDNEETAAFNLLAPFKARGLHAQLIDF
jgi:hypothetical protein